MTPDALAARLDAALERAELREWLTYPGDPEGNAPLTRREARGLLDDIDRLTAERDEARLLMGDWAARAGAAEAERDDLAAAVERVRALAEEWRYKGEHGHGPWQAGSGPSPEGEALDWASSLILRALDGGE